MISIFSASYSRENPWQHPWLFVVMQDWGWIDYRDPSPPKLAPPLATWFRSLPEVGQWTEPDWIELTGPDFDGQTMRLRLSDAGVVEPDGQELRQIEITQARGDADPQTSTFTIDPAMFAEGLPPEEFLRWPAVAPSTEQRTRAVSLLRGLPRRRNYRAGTIRYLKTPLRGDAFRSQRAASQILFRPNDGDRFENTDEVDISNERELRYRTDLWLSEEVPFGILRVTTTVSDPKTGAIIARRTLTASAVSRLLPTATEAAAPTDRTEEPESNADDN
jgi:hypothetical protein